MGITMETFAVGALGCNCTIVADTGSGDALVVDGGDGVDEVLQRLERHGRRARYLLHTHAHIDHIAWVGRLRDHTGAAALLHPADLPLYRAMALQAQWIGLTDAPTVVALDGDLEDAQELRLGDAHVTVLHTPGHTPGSVCFAVADEGSQATLLTGDTLFAGSIGRWDMGGTSMEEIIASIRRQLLIYPDATPVIPGHGPMSTIGTERHSNPYLLVSAV
ncbi:MAG: MBL fold metallo-hydrolase [Vulcanimicrobiaceae bacterium]